jgi:Leucine-rich repeat (LRR) protein
MKKTTIVMHRLFPLFLIVTALFCQTNAIRADRAADSLQLVILYNSTSGSTWSITWDLAQPMNTWHGITLDASGQVLSVSLPNNNLKGALPNLFLPRCVLLSLSRNTLRDTLPILSGLPSVRTVDLSHNEMDGHLFDFNMPKVETLNLSNNKIQGPIPDFSKMPLLEILVLENNRLDEGLPDFSKISQLRTLRVSNNLLEGQIPEFNFLPNLLTLDLHGNRFIGVPPAFRGSIELFVVDLSHNNLTGFVPGFSRLLQLETLRLNNNRLTGTVNNFSALKVLSELDISNNLLEGPLPDMTFNKELNDFRASGNNFSGKIPSFAGMNQLQRLDISNNKLTDTLPNLSYLPSLVELRVDSNLLVHSNFDATTAPSLRVLEVHFNRFTFSDIFHINGTSLNTFIYGPQKPIQLPDTIYATIHENVTIDLVEDFSVGNNTYRWFLDDVFLVATGVNELRLPSINALDQGTYYAIVRNDNLQGLILPSEEVYLKMDCPYNEVTIIDSICVGDTLYVNNKPYFQSGDYRDTLIVPDPSVCDSIFIISLSVFPEYDTTLFDTICESDQVMFAGQIIEESGFYTDTLTSVHGCDSIVHLNLIVHPAYTKVADVDLCAGDTLFVGDLIRTVTGIYFDTLQTIHGCDSVIITDLTVLDTFFSVTDVKLCFGETYEFRGVTYDESGTYIDRFTNELGCDSIYQLNLVIPVSDHYPMSRIICVGDSVVVGTNVYKTPGTYTDSLMTEDGCDSIVVLTLGVTEKFELEYDFIICTGDTLFFGGDTLTRAGIYIDSLTAQGGCDSIVKVRLNLRDFLIENIDTLLCFGDSVIIGDDIIKVDGEFIDTIAGERCDTLVFWKVTVNPEIELEDLRTVVYSSGTGFIEPSFTGGSGGFEYRWNTGVTTQILDSVLAGNYQLTVTDAVGCNVSFGLVLDPSTAVNDQLSGSVGITIYPNPAAKSQDLQIVFDRLTTAGDFQFRLFDLHGRILLDRKVTLGTSSRQTIRLPVPDNPGLYTIQVMDSQGGFTARRVMVH